jgi:hypothetical protein
MFSILPLVLSDCCVTVYQCGSAVGSCLAFVVTTMDKAPRPLELRTCITVQLLDETGNRIPTVSFIAQVNFHLQLKCYAFFKVLTNAYSNGHGK